jgi:hypothetical protein
MKATKLPLEIGTANQQPQANAEPKTQLPLVEEE